MGGIFEDGFICDGHAFPNTPILLRINPQKLKKNNNSANLNPKLGTLVALGIVKKELSTVADLS